jgi:hypothetical protein
VDVKSQGGFILVTCLLISLMIAVVAMYFTNVVRQRILGAQRVDDYVVASLKAWSAYQDMIYVLTTTYFTETGVYLALPSRGATSSPFATDARGPDDARIFLNFFGEAFQWGEGVKVTLKDLSGQVPLVGGNPDIFRAFLGSCGVNSARANMIADGIEDWQDKDNLKRLNGAEAWEYKAAGAKYGPRNSTFQTLDELNLVLGMTKDVFTKLQPELTYRGGGTINCLNASPALLRMLLPSDDHFVRMLIEARSRCLVDDNVLQALASRLPEAGESIGVPDKIQIFVEARYGDSAATIKTIYSKKPTLRTPYRTLLWKR